jgi:tetratricopeptide (TPR) repeat protein
MAWIDDVTHFQLANDLRDTALLQELHSRLDKIHGLTQKIADKVDVVHEDVRDIKQILARTRQSTTFPPMDTVTRQQIPLKPPVFHGRDSLVEEISQSLMEEETARVCILGPGGMGKTSVALAVVELSLIKERFPGGNCVWVPCIEATSVTLLLEILYVQLQIPGDKQVTLDKIISELDASTQPRLILLDNFETPWNAPGGTQKQVDDILRKLAMLSHVAILITMRGSYPPCDDAIEWQAQMIQPTDEAACLRIFHDVNPSSQGDPDVGRLLAALGHMPFAVTLMANLGKRGKSTAKELLDTWYTSGTNMLSITNSLERNMNRSISLSVDSEFVKQDPDALLLLSILSMLPAGTTKENLHWWAPTVKMIPSAIATLSDAALLVENKREDSNSPILFVLPVVQSFMQQRDRVTKKIWSQIHSSCCQYVLAHACRYDDSTFSVKSKAVALEDTNIQSILFGSSSMQHSHLSDRVLEALIAFSWHRCDTKPNIDITNHAVTAAKASGIKRYLASAVWCLGRTHYQLSNDRLSYHHLQEAYRLFNTLPPDDLELQRLGGQCGIDLVDTARLALDDKGKAVSLARDIEMKCAALSDDLIHARSLIFLGFALNTAQQGQEALVHLEHARTILKAANNTPNLAEACQAIAHVHYYHEGMVPEALNAVEEAWKHAESIDSPFIQGTISLTFGEILFSANRDTEAWKHIEIALTKASYIGDRLTAAQALRYMGYGYLRRGDYQNAYGAYEAAAEKYHAIGDPLGEEKCKDNMARIQQKQRNPDAVVGFYRPGGDIDKSLFYPVRVSK